MIQSILLKHDKKDKAEQNETLLTVADINFDGTDDLLLLESYSVGCDYYGFVWNKDIDDFENYPSFPSDFYRLELNELLSYYEMGELVATHIVTNGSAEAGQLYQELNYWMKGQPNY